MTGEGDFIAKERAEVAALMSQAGAPPNPSGPAPQQQQQQAPQQLPPNANGFQQEAPQQQEAPREPIQNDDGLSTQVFTPPGMDQFTQGQAPQDGTTQQQEQQPGQDGQNAPPPGVLEERTRRQQAERDLAETRAQQARLSDRLDMMNQVIAGQQQQRMDATQPQPPDPSEDLQGYVEHLNGQYTQQLEQIQNQYAGLQQQQQQAAAVENLRSQSRAQAQAYAQQNPEFGQAYEYYRQSRAAELAAQGFAPEVVANAVETEELNLAQAHLQSGRNVAEALHAAAKARGFQSKQQGQPNPNQQQQTQPTYQQPAYQAPQQQQFQGPQPGQPGYQQPMEQVQAGMMASQSLQNVPQAGAASPTTLEAYANMSDAQFAQHMDNVKAMLGQ